MISVQRVESVMRGFFRIDHSLRSVAMLQALDAPKEEAAPPFDPLTLPALAQSALLSMHESHVKRAVIARLTEDAQCGPGLDDYRALVDLNLAKRSEGKRYHDLTTEGRIAAGELQRALCKRFGIHLLLELGHFRHEQRYHCPCGWSTAVLRDPYASRNARNQFNRHISTAQGMSKLFVALKPQQQAEG